MVAARQSGQRGRCASRSPAGAEARDDGRGARGGGLRTDRPGVGVAGVHTPRGHVVLDPGRRALAGAVIGGEQVRGEDDQERSLAAGLHPDEPVHALDPDTRDGRLGEVGQRQRSRARGVGVSVVDAQSTRRGRQGADEGLREVGRAGVGDELVEAEGGRAPAETRVVDERGQARVAVAQGGHGASARPQRGVEAAEREGGEARHPPVEVAARDREVTLTAVQLQRGTGRGVGTAELPLVEPRVVGGGGAEVRGRFEEEGAVGAAQGGRGAVVEAAEVEVGPVLGTGGGHGPAEGGTEVRRGRVLDNSGGEGAGAVRVQGDGEDGVGGRRGEEGVGVGDAGVEAGAARGEKLKGDGEGLAAGAVGEELGGDVEGGGGGVRQEQSLEEPGAVDEETLPEGEEPAETAQAVGPLQVAWSSGGGRGRLGQTLRQNSEDSEPRRRHWRRCRVEAEPERLETRGLLCRTGSCPLPRGTTRYPLPIYLPATH